MANEEVGTLKGKVTLDQAEFNKGMDNLSKKMQVIGQDFKLASAGLYKVSDASKLSALNIKRLTDSIDVQKERISGLEKKYKDAKDRLGENAQETLKYETRLKGAQIALKGMEKELSSATSEAEKQKSAFTKLGDKLTAFSKSCKDTGAQVTSVGKALTTGLTIPIAAGVAALGALVKSSLETADGLQQMSDVTGLSTERLQELTYVGTKLDVELDTMTGVQSKLTKAMAAAQDGTKAQTDAFKALGVDAVDPLTGQLRDSNTVFAEAIEALGNMTNPTERDAIALQLFGKSALELNPLIKAGSDEIARLTDEARTNGAVMSGESVQALDEFGDELEAAKLSLKTAASGIAVDLLPSLEKLLKSFKEKGIPAIEKFTKFVGDLIEKFSELSPEMQTATIGLIGLAAAIGPVLTGVGNMITAFGTITTVLGKASKAISGISAAAVGAFGIVAAAVAGLVVDVGWLLTDFEGFKKTFGVFSQGIAGLFGPIGGLIYVIKDWDNQMAQLQKTWDSFIEYLGLSDEVIEKSSAPIPHVIKDFEGLRAGVDDTVQSYADMAKKVDASTTELTVEQQANLAKLLQDSKDYQAALEEATRTHLAQMGDLDDRGIEKSKLTAEQVKKNLDKQIADFRTWQESIKTLSSRIPPDVAADLEKLGPNAVIMIKGLNKMTDTELEEWVKTWREKASLAKSSAKEELKSLPEEVRTIGSSAATTFAEGMQSKDDYIRKNGAALAEAAKSSTTVSLFGTGQDTGQGYADGIKSKKQAVENAASSLASAAREIMDRRLEISSPSKVTRRTGQMTGEGLAIGIEDKIKAVALSAQKLSIAALPQVGPVNLNAIRSLNTQRINSLSGAALNSQSITNNNSTTKTIIGGVTVQNMYVRNDNDVKLVAKELDRLKQTRQRAGGVAI